MSFSVYSHLVIGNHSSHLPMGFPSSKEMASIIYVLSSFAI
jgi:hypothetical protein